MIEPPPSFSDALIIAAFAAAMMASAVYVSIVWIKIAYRAIRTGRLLARGAIYDRQTTPVRFRLVFSAGLFTVLLSIVMAVATCWLAWTVFTTWAATPKDGFLR